MKKRIHFVTVTAAWAATHVLTAFAAAGADPLPQSTQSTATSGQSANASETGGGSGGLEEVVVTAERRAEPLQTTPIAVTAVSGVQLQNLQINDPSNLNVVAPELRFVANVTTPTNYTPSLRGAPQQNPALITEDSPVGTYIDDIYVASMNANNLMLNDIEQVEILRGPQGTLYGRNTLTGAVKFDSRTPGQDQEWANASISAGNYEQTRDLFSVGGPLGDSGWGGSISGLYTYKNGEWRNIGTDGKWDMERNLGGRMKVHYSGLEGFDFTAFLSYAKSENTAIPLVPFSTPYDPQGLYQYSNSQIVPKYGYYTVNVPSHDYGTPYIADLPFGDTRQSIAGATLAWQVNDALTLKSITGWVRTMDAYTTDFAGDDPFTNPVGVSGSGDDSNQVTEELQAVGKALGGRLDYVAGAYYLDDRARQNIGFYGFGLGPLSYSNLSVDTHSYSLFGQADYRLTSALKATVGLRWTEDRKHFGVDLTQLGVVPLYFGTAFTGLESFNVPFVAMTPKAELSYTLPASSWEDSLMAYLSASRGFQSGGVSGVNLFNLEGATQPYSSQYVWNYELGLKSDFLEHHLRVNAAFFIENISDLVLSEAQTVGPGLTAFPELNAGDARVRGLELEISAVPTQGLTLFFNPVFNSSEFTALAPGAGPYLSRFPHNDPASLGDGYSVPDPQPPLLPWFSASVGFDYVRAMDLGAGDGAFIAGADWYRSASYINSATEDYIVSPYDRLNGYLGVRWSKSWELRLSGKNLQNRATFVNATRGLGGGYDLPPREWLVRLSYNR